MKTVLMPVYAFPPLNCGGTLRPAKFARFLPEFGWCPVVVAPDWNEENSGGSFDPRMGRTLSCEVVRVPYERPALGRRSALGKRIDRWLWDEPHFRAIHADMLAACRAIARERKIDAVFASSFYRFLHRIAGSLHGDSGIPWIADHRDLVDQEWSREKGSLARSLWMKREVLLDSYRTKTAAAVTTVSEPLADRLRSRNRAPVQVIMNGFDPDDFPAVQGGSGKKELFEIVYCGSFFGRSDPAVFLDGLDRLCIEEPELCCKVQVWFYGKNSTVIRKHLQDRPCAGLIHCGGFVVHEEALRRQMEAQVLYLISHPSKGIATGKIFEYLHAGRPVMSVPGDGDITDRILAETGAGVVCRSAEEVVAQLAAWLRVWKVSGALPRNQNSSAVEAYGRRNQARQLADLLNDIVGDPGRVR